MFRRLYDWTLSLASRPAAPWALGVVSFAESSFFPVPPDVMFVPMALARPDRAWFYALVMTVTSVAGGLVGYAIGALLYESVGQWLFRIYGLTDGAEAFRAAYDLFWFVVLSIVTRGARFFFLAAILGRFGPAIKGVIDAHFNKVMAGLAVTIVGGFVAFRYLF